MAAGTQIVDVAERIVADIRRRKLRPGDPYLNTAETARRMRASGSTVNRALQLLAQRGVVHRRQRQGTIVARPPTDAGLERVHLLVREDHLRTEGLWAEGVLLGLQGALAGVELQFNFRPQADDGEYVEKLIGDVLRARQAAGLVLIRSTVAAQRLVEASGLPAVVSGTLQPSVTGLPSVDRDQRQIGELLADHLVAQGCERFVILLRERLAAGDHGMLDGALARLAAAGVSLDRVAIRCLPTDERAIAAAAAELLSAASPERVGFLCRSEALARAADGAAAAQKVPARRRAVLVVADARDRGADDFSYACTESFLSPAEWGAALGRALLASARGTRPDPYRLVIPVRLRLPARTPPRSR